MTTGPETTPDALLSAGELDTLIGATVYPRLNADGSITERTETLARLLRAYRAQEAQLASYEQSTGGLPLPNPISGLNGDGWRLWGDQESVQRVLRVDHDARHVLPAVRQRLDETLKELADLRAQLQASNDRTVDAQVLAHQWMCRHDRINAGKPGGEFPSPADVPNIIAERDTLRAQVERQAAENEGLKLLLEGRIVPDVDALLRGVVSAWEALGEGDWPPSLIENWLRTSMWPAVNAVRTCLTAEPRKDEGARE